MINERILLSFVGNRDPYSEGEDPGPVLSLLQNRRFDRAVLLCSDSSYIERARSVEEIMKGDEDSPAFTFIDLKLESPVDYSEIYIKLKEAFSRFTERYAHWTPSYSVLLDPGTPQIQTVLFLLAHSGSLKAELLQGVPPKFAGGSYKVRTVTFDGEHTVFSAIPARSDLSGPVHFLEEPGDIGTSPGLEYRRPSFWISGKSRDIIGESSGFRAILEKTLQVSGYDISVLIRGETGTGKGVFARLIHENSRRKGQPFLPVNCAAITPSLAESELFGHVKGAFTGADRDRIGQFRAADGGTVFLDEIGDLPVELQPKLLRALEEKVIVPVGTEKEYTVDVRIMAATNRDLEEMILEKTFRRDLFERLNNFTLEIPPLRERKTDIPLMLGSFINEWNSTYGEEKGLSEEAIALLIEYPWPGNVRELQNAVKSILAVGRSEAIGPELFPDTIRRHFKQGSPDSLPPLDLPDEGMDLKAFLFQVEKTLCERAIEKTGGNREQAAALLGINAPAFRKALRERFGIVHE